MDYGTLIETKTGFIVCVREEVGMMRVIIVGFVEPDQLSPRSVEVNLGKDLSSPNIQKMKGELSKLMVPVKTFTWIGRQPTTGRLVGVIENRSTREFTVRIIGFTNPKGLEKKYRELLEKKEKPPIDPDDEEQVEKTYWENYNLGRQWIGTSIGYDERGMTLFKYSNGKTLPLTKPMLIEHRYEQ